MSEAPKKGWWGRNWKWFVPSGCLIMVLLCGGGFYGIFSFGLKMIKGSEPYVATMEAVRDSDLVIDAIGEPIEESGIPQAQVVDSGNTGSFTGTIPISGPKADAIIRVAAQKMTGKWEFLQLEVVVQGTGQQIQLLDQEGEPALPEGP